MYDNNPYYSPEKSGLEIIGEVDFSDGSYQFNYLVVWKDLATGKLYYAEDSGCSCPSPFEDYRYPGSNSSEQLTPATAHEITAQIGQRLADRSKWHADNGTQEAADLIAKVMAL